MTGTRKAHGAGAAAALRALASPEARVMRLPGAAQRFGVFDQGDRRRRPRASLSAAEVAALMAEGALAAAGPDVYRLTEAGAARRDRGAGPEAGPRDVTSGFVVDETGTLREAVRAASAPVRLSRLKDAAGAAWFTQAELAAAHRLCADLEDAGRGGMRLSRWGETGGAPGARGSAGAELALSKGAQARLRAERALGQLAPPLRALAQAACVEELTLDALERRQGWPPRSARVGLKLALSQLAQAYQAL